MVHRREAFSPQSSLLACLSDRFLRRILEGAEGEALATVVILHCLLVCDCECFGKEAAERAGRCDAIECLNEVSGR